MPLNKDRNGNSVSNKGVKICIKSEFLHIKIFFFSPPSLSYPTVTFERCVKSFTIVTAEYFFSFQFLKSHTQPHNRSVPQISLSVAFSHSLN